MAKVLIVGCGDVGLRLARLCSAATHEVYALRRSPWQEAPIHFIQGDVSQPDLWVLPDNIEYVFVTLAPSQSGEAAYRQVYFEGTRQLLHVLKAQPSIKRIFWVSSSSVWAQNAGEWVDETLAAVPQSATAKVLYDSEQLLAQSSYPYSIIRFAGIYGPSRYRLLNWVREARPVQVEPPAWTNRIHVDDCAGVLFFLFVQDIAGCSLESVYIGTDSTPAPQHEVLDWLADQMHLPRVAHERRPEGASNKRLSNQRLLALGYTFRYPCYQSGYASIVAECTI